jgi:hypothetical protein
MEVNNLIYNVRGLHVMLDSDLAELFEVQTKVFNQAVKRNISRFPNSFRFQLTKDEYAHLRSQIVTLKIGDGTDNLRSQIVTSSEHGGRRYLPYVFTEQGVAMLAGVIRSEIAIEMSIKIMTAFVEMRKFISKNALLIDRINTIETRQLMYQNDSNEKFNQLFNALQRDDETKKESIFFDGQIYDAYSFIIKLIKKAKADIILIDNKELYHIGASLKDLGKKLFAFSLMEDKELTTNILKRL